MSEIDDYLDAVKQEEKDQETKDSLYDLIDEDYVKVMSIAQDEDFLDAQKEERDQETEDSLTADLDRLDFQTKLKEEMLTYDLIDEIDLSIGRDDFVDTVLSNPEESRMTEIEKDTEEGKREWSKEYDYHVNNPPKEGDILTAANGANVLLLLELVPGTPPFIYGRANVPEIVGAALGWFLQSSDSPNFHGWKCILLPRARTELIRRFGLQNETMEVKSLRVIRPSQSGKSLLCEVEEYVEEVAQKEAPVDDVVPFVEGAQDTSEAVEVKPDAVTEEL